MNFRLTAFLLGSIFVFALVLLIVSFTGGDRPSSDVILEELAASKPDQIDTVEFEREGGARLKLTRNKDKDWSLTEPYAAKADSAAVNEVVGALLKAKPTSHPGMPNNLAATGLQPAKLKVTLRHGERSSTVNLGNVTLGGKGVVFVTTSTRSKRPMAVPRGSLEALFREANKDGVAADLAKWAGDYRSKAVFAADTRGAGDDVTGIVLSARGKSVSLTQGPRGWKFVAPAGWGDADTSGDTAASPGTFTGVRPLLGALTGLQALAATDFIDNPSPQDLEKYGLNPNNPDAVKVELTNKDKITTVAYIGKKDEPGTPDPKSPHGMMPQTGKWWVKVEGQPGVIRANGGDLSGLLGVIENPDPLRDRTLLSLDKSRIDGLELANGAVVLRKVGGALAAWKLYGNTAAGDPQVASLLDVEKVVNTLLERRTIKSFPPPNDANFGPGGTVVKVWADGFEAATDPKAEPKQKGKPVVLTFGKQDGDSVYVRRELADGTKEDFLLPQKVKLGAAGEPVDLVAWVSKGRVDFLDKDLKGFSSEVANKLTVTGVLTFELDQTPAEGSTGGDVWKFAADTQGTAGQVYKKGDQADTSVVQGMLDILATTQSVTRYVDETPSPEKLAEYGLGPTPRLKVVVGLKSTSPEDKERIYEFGKETADPNFVYARQGGKQAVFTLPKFVYDKFPADLRNKNIFKVSPDQVARIEIQGWGDKFGAPADLVLVKKDGNWTTEKAPTAGFTVDPTKVAAFLTALGTLQVRTYTGSQGIEPHHELIDPKKFFVVTLVNPQGGHHLHIRVGGNADTNGNTIYALTNRVPEGKPIVTVDAAPFKTYKDGPAAFAK
jgi:hypothetical protein